MSIYFFYKWAIDSFRENAAVSSNSLLSESFTCAFWLQQVGCDHGLGSSAVLDACGVCEGDNSTCKFFKGQYLIQHKANGKENCSP